MTRRDVMKTAALGSLATLASSNAVAGVNAPDQLTYGLQLYTLLDALRTDLAGCLREVARMGYRHVEMLTFMGKTGAELRTLLDASGLACHSIQVLSQPIPGSTEPSLGGDMSALIEQATALGVRYVVLPSFPPPVATGAFRPGEDYTQYFRRAAKLMTGDDWRALADQLNTLGEPLSKAGLTLAYHNHNPEFAPVETSNGLAILLERVDPRLATFELDVGWVRAAGIDPADLLLAHPGRFKMIHLKDVSAHGLPNVTVEMSSVPVGSGIIDWKALLPAARASGVEHYYVEQEPPFAIPAAQAVKQSLDYLNALQL